MTYKNRKATATLPRASNRLAFVLMVLIIGLLIMPGSRSSASTVVLQDDFNDNVLDPAKWTINTSIPQGSASVVEQNGRVELTNRGYLNTAQQFDPVALCGITITGEWTIAGAGDDFLQAATRSNGTPAGSAGELQNGIEYFVFGNSMSIVGRGTASGTVTSTGSTGSLNFVAGVTYVFEIIDDGFNLSFTLTNKVNPSQTKTVTATSSFHPATNLVTFHNRELCCGGTHIAHLDNVVITREQCPFNFTGFFSPVSNPPVLNSVNAGRAIPVKFSLDGDQGLNIFAAGFPASQQIACDSSAPIGAIEETVTAGGSSLSYDPVADQYIYVWKTDDAWAGTCRQLIVKLSDGSTQTANFKFK